MEIDLVYYSNKQIISWQLSSCSLCNLCQIEEDYIHLFMLCHLSLFGVNVIQLFKKVDFEISISFSRLVLGYKILNKEYFDFIYILTILGYSIYKCTNHMCRNKKQKRLFVKELRTRLNVCKNIYSTMLFSKIQHVLKNNYEKYMIYVL